MHKLIYRSGLRDLPQSALDRAVIADLQAALATDREGPLHPGRLLAAMLFLPPHALPRFVELGMIPEWLWADYIPYALTPPGLFHALGEADAYADWAGRWISHLHDSLLPNLRRRLGGITPCCSCSTPTSFRYMATTATCATSSASARRSWKPRSMC
ncbi:MAG: hypothetical protein WDO24_17205 [Pseudomonadota bacterium]